MATGPPRSGRIPLVTAIAGISKLTRLHGLPGVAGPVACLGPIAIHLLQPMPSHPRELLRPPGALAAEDPPADGGAPTIGEFLDLGLELTGHSLRRAHRAPFALPEVGPVVLAQADHVDLRGLRPVLADFEGGVDSLPPVELGEGFPGEALEALAVVPVQVRPDQVLEGLLRAHVPDVAHVGEDEAEPE